MRIGVCFFIESNLGGAATQADDMVTAARRLGHEACLLRFATSPRAKDLWSLSSKGLPPHTLHIGRAGMRFSGPRLLATPGRVGTSLIQWVNTFDLLLFVGGCPHLTRSFTEDDFSSRFASLYTETKCAKIMFFTDPFWRKLYPYCARVIERCQRVYAFSESYRRSIVDSGLCDKVAICNFGSIAAVDRAKRRGVNGKVPLNRLNRIVWPHQWRSWKNPLLFVRAARHFDKEVSAYADGIEYHLIRRDHWNDWVEAVRWDAVKDQELSREGTITYYGTVPQEKVLETFSTHRWMVDLTGVSGRMGGESEKFAGNYQCVNLECMMLGCVNLKYQNTVAPSSRIPAECVVSLPLSTDPKELASLVNERTDSETYRRVSPRSREWALAEFDPLKVFAKDFIS